MNFTKFLKAGVLTLGLCCLTSGGVANAEETTPKEYAEPADAGYHANTPYDVIETIHVGNDPVITVTGTLTPERDEKGDAKKPDVDVYKLVFDTDGKTDFKIEDLTDFSMNEHIQHKSRAYMLAEDLKTKWGFQGDNLWYCPDMVYYLVVQQSTANSNLEYANYSYDGHINDHQYKVTLITDTEKTYVRPAAYSGSGNAYELEEDKQVYSYMYLDDSAHTTFKVTVPKGKKATFNFSLDPSANREYIAKDPFNIVITRLSDGKTVTFEDIKSDNWSLGGWDEYINGEEKPSTHVDLTNDTFYFTIKSKTTGYGSCNEESYMVWYTLKDFKGDNEDKDKDNSKPVISGVKNNKTYKKPVKITYTSDNEIKSARINGKKFKSGKVVKKNGSYTVVVTDKNGKTTTVKFQIRLKK